ncbi:hypothetical protein GCM10011491_07640 [Brucella endophytica]|uniref:Uncharacterized protein n=1 Tax=Brucella endophytica TaxID=1963359 RepID=A0A916WAI2_9HYPH|nr:hypothetical protein [Brucella endophytica]GGA82681.1 hypothetical protein GCM10011491_07640 [Brucella endophytica]
MTAYNLYWTAAFTNSLQTRGWSPPKPLLNLQSTTPPALAAFNGYDNGKLWCVYMDPTTNSLRYVYFNTDWKNSGPIINDATTDRVGLAVFENNLYCAYRRPDNTLYTVMSTDGNGWGQSAHVANASGNLSPAFGPGVAALDNNSPSTLCCAYSVGGTTGTSIASNDGVHWSGPYSGFGGAPFSPGLAAFKEQFWLVNGDMTSAGSGDGLSWPNGIAINYASTDVSPTLAYSPSLDALICVYGSQGSYFFYSINTTGDPNKWSSPTVILGPSRAPGTSVGVAEVDGVIYIAYCNSN